jgi:type II secretory pathway pseudopilin PulG
MPANRSIRGARGCSLIEVLVAIGIFTVALVALAQLTAIAARANLQAARTSFATVIAQQKIEELLPGDLAVNLSPPGALTTSLDGWFDFVDRHSRSLGSGARPPAGSDYLRRWSVEPVTGSETLLVQVAVIDMRQAMTADAAAMASRRPDQVWLVAAKGRHAF